MFKRLWIILAVMANAIIASDEQWNTAIRNAFQTPAAVSNCAALYKMQKPFYGAAYGVNENPGFSDVYDEFQAKSMAYLQSDAFVDDTRICLQQAHLSFEDAQTFFKIFETILNVQDIEALIKSLQLTMSSGLINPPAYAQQLNAEFAQKLQNLK